MIYLKIGDIKNAEKYFQASIINNEINPKSYFQIGKIYYYQNSYKTAEGNLAKSVAH